MFYLILVLRCLKLVQHLCICSYKNIFHIIIFVKNVVVFKEKTNTIANTIKLYNIFTKIDTTFEGGCLSI